MAGGAPKAERTRAKRRLGQCSAMSPEGGEVGSARLTWRGANWRELRYPRVEVRLVGEDRLAVLARPAGDADTERKRVVEDLLRVLAAHERGDQLAVRLVCLVDVERLVRIIVRIRSAALPLSGDTVTA